MPLKKLHFKNIFNRRSRIIVEYRKGKLINAAKGHPSNDETATLNVAILNFLHNHVEKNIIVKYIENELGKKAALEMNIPGEKSWKINHILATRASYQISIDLYIAVSATAHTAANITRIQ